MFKIFGAKGVFGAKGERSDKNGDAKKGESDAEKDVQPFVTQERLIKRYPDLDQEGECRTLTNAVLRRILSPNGGSVKRVLDKVLFSEGATVQALLNEKETQERLPEEEKRHSAFFDSKGEKGIHPHQHQKMTTEALLDNFDRIVTEGNHHLISYSTGNDEHSNNGHIVWLGPDPDPEKELRTCYFDPNRAGGMGCGDINEIRDLVKFRILMGSGEGAAYIGTLQLQNEKVPTEEAAIGRSSEPDGSALSR